MAMQLTPEQQAMLDGAQGEVMAKVVKTLVMYGDTFGAGISSNAREFCDGRR